MFYLKYCIVLAGVRRHKGKASWARTQSIEYQENWTINLDGLNLSQKFKSLISIKSINNRDIHSAAEALVYTLVTMVIGPDIKTDRRSSIIILFILRFSYDDNNVDIGNSSTQ